MVTGQQTGQQVDLTPGGARKREVGGGVFGRGDDRRADSGIRN